MLWLAFVAATAAQADAPRRDATPQVQAKATVRIVRAMPIRFDEIEQQTPATLRRGTIRLPDGGVQQARLIEFQ